MTRPILPPSASSLSPSPSVDSPARRSCLLGLGASALLGACGGGGDSAGDVDDSGAHGALASTPSLSTLPADIAAQWDAEFGTTVFRTKSQWIAAKDKYRKLVIDALMRRPFYSLTSASPQALLDAIEYVRTHPDANGNLLPIRLVPGETTSLTSTLVIPPRAGVPQPIEIFSELGPSGPSHVIDDLGTLELETPVHLYNVRFQQKNRQIACKSGQRLRLWFNQFLCNIEKHTDPTMLKRQAVAFYGLSDNGRMNVLDMQWNEVFDHGAVLWGRDLVDSTVAYNAATTKSTGATGLRSEGGYRNTFRNNYLEGGRTGIAFPVKARTRTDGSLSAARHQSHVDTTITHNFLTRIREESIGLDCMGNESLDHSVLDTLRLGRAGAMHGVLTPHSDSPRLLVWRDYTAEGGRVITDEDLPTLRFKNYFVMVLNGPDRVRGKYAQVTDWTAVPGHPGVLSLGIRSPGAADNKLRTAATARPGELSLEDMRLPPSEGLGDGLLVNISAMPVNFKISHNIIHNNMGLTPLNTAGINLWGAGNDFEISNNEIIWDGQKPSVHKRVGIGLAHVTVSGKTRPEYTTVDGKTVVHRIPTYFGPHAYATMPVTRGKIFDNKLGGLPILMTNRCYSMKSMDFPYFTYDVSVTGNSGLGSAVAPTLWMDDHRDDAGLQPVVPHKATFDAKLVTGDLLLG